jgi:hypothetical protein
MFQRNNLIDYANLSADIYADRAGTAQNITIQISAQNTQNVPSFANGWYRVVHMPKLKLNPSQPFFAALYIKYQNGHATDACIAFRGTVQTDMKNILVDVWSWYSDVIGGGAHDHLPAYNMLTDAHCFTRHAFDYLNTNHKHLFLTNRVAYTGHSLGGALAQLMTLQNTHVRPAYVFNSPGCGHLPNINKQLNGFIHNTSARYGFINKIGECLGELNYVDVKECANDAKAMLAAENMNLMSQSEVMMSKPTGAFSKATQTFNSAMNVSENILGGIGSTASQIGASLGSSMPPILFRLMALISTLKPISEPGKKVDLNAIPFLLRFHRNKQAIKQNLNGTEMLFSKLTKIIMSQHDIGHVIEAI